MPVRKITIALSEELDSALTLAALEASTSKSRVIETFLREHGTVQEYVDQVRSEPDATPLAAGPHARRSAAKKATRAVSSSGRAAPIRDR